MRSQNIYYYGAINLIALELFGELTAADRVVKSEQCLSAVVEDETVLMSIESGCYAGLDDIGSEIWQCLEKPITVAELCDGLASKYEASRSVIEADVLAFLHSLWQKQMIEIVRE